MPVAKVHIFADVGAARKRASVLCREPNTASLWSESAKAAMAMFVDLESYRGPA